MRFAGQTDRVGLGSGRYLSKPTTTEVRAKTTEVFNLLQEEKHLRHASCLVQQGVWTHWDDVRPFDLSWRNLIYGPGPRVIAFVLNAQINSVRTPDMLKLWGKIESAHCPLCSHPKCTLHHILVNCPVGLKQKRYHWRHDSVLANIEPALIKLISEINHTKPMSSFETTKKSFQSCFVRAGQKPSPKRKVVMRRGLLEAANDWVLLVDYDHKSIVFPPVIYATNERPDIILWSRKTRHVVLVELTCCAEEGTEAAQFRKNTRYLPLLTGINEQGVWKAELFTIEVGARGLVAGPTFQVFVKLGFSRQEANQLCQTLSVIVARCSYAIYLSHKNPDWLHSDLIIEHSTPSQQISG
jgi:hypothetical protein